MYMEDWMDRTSRRARTTPHLKSLLGVLLKHHVSLYTVLSVNRLPKDLSLTLTLN